MMNAIIIEDELPAQITLSNMLEKSLFNVHVQAILGSVKEGVSYFSEKRTPDVIFSNVQLTDGLSFEIFNTTSINIPVIFISRYDKYLVEALEFNGIDYLLKPIDKTDLDKSLLKYSMLRKHFLSSPPFKGFPENIFDKKRSRIIVKRGTENVIIKTDEIAAFYSENRLVYAIDKSGKKFITNKNLGELEQKLDGSIFYRVNRQYIVNINFIKGYKSFEKVKLKVDLTLPETNHSMIVSQETAPHFRKWVSGI